ncbi:alpha/beta hydrolase [Aldersonia kunmingensis]|uniref:alpha/beta hydrolase n=1 Tax=Aldersonia kunmingensis TaxID=408066 RepID=UPI000A058697|nr:alpha/beta hydrolase family protein [Aldersonia kunmingensis]
MAGSAAVAAMLAFTGVANAVESLESETLQSETPRSETPQSESLKSETSESESLDSGSLDSGSLDFGSLATGSVGPGSSVPEAFVENPDPVPPTRDDITTPAIVGQKIVSAQQQQLTIASPALRREVTVQVLAPVGGSTGRPVLYMLDGVSAPEHASDWSNRVVRDFFADKDTNVVFLNGGRGSMYTDWDLPDPRLGWNRWETFITDELPPLIDAKLGANGRNVIAGNSMGAQAAMMLAHRNPTLYAGVAAYSGCYSTSDTLGRLSAQLTTTSQGGDPANMWSNPTGPAWVEHDTLRNAEALRGKELYVSAGTGRPGPLEEGANARTLLIGGVLEAGANMCTRQLESRLDQLRIPATFSYSPTGVHDWPLWLQELPESWPSLQRGLGI